MVSKELLERAKKCSTKEELLELAKSENVVVSDDEINALLATSGTNRELSDDELENVTGGTCHSSCTYEELGITPVLPQDSSCHPVITTIGNSCAYYKGTCYDCGYHITIGASFYCRVRSYEIDATKW